MVRQIQSGQLKYIASYTLGETIGEGTFGKVKAAIHKPTNLPVAIKCVDRIHAASLVREIETWRHLQHPHIARLYEVICTENKIFMVSEYCAGGEMFDYLLRNGRLDDSLAREWSRQIASALIYCHKKQFVHR